MRCGWNTSREVRLEYTAGHLDPELSEQPILCLHHDIDASSLFSAGLNSPLLVGLVPDERAEDGGEEVEVKVAESCNISIAFLAAYLPCTNVKKGLILLFLCLLPFEPLAIDPKAPRMPFKGMDCLVGS